jgi:dephospho-CoA kinase
MGDSQRNGCAIRSMELARSVVIAFSGGVASGKSSVATRIAERLAWPCASFGSFVRRIARSRGLQESREVLQEIGGELVGGDLRAFCLAVIGQTTWTGSGSLVLDGVRHIEILPILREVTAPAELLMVFVDTPRELRFSRLQQRAGKEGEPFDQIEAHSTEVQVPRLEALADLRIDGTRKIEELADEVMGWLCGRPKL